MLSATLGGAPATHCLHLCARARPYSAASFHLTKSSLKKDASNRGSRPTVGFESRSRPSKGGGERRGRHSSPCGIRAASTSARPAGRRETMAPGGAGGEVDMVGKVCVVTGANTGMGIVTAKELAKRGAAVVMACRSEAKGRAAEAAVREAVRTGGRPRTAGTAEFMPLDLSSLASVRAFADALAANRERVDVLVNNAGIMIPPYALTTDGFESQFQVNHLSHYLLTRLLVPLLERSAAPAVVHVSSLAGERVAIKKGEFWKIARCNAEEYNAWQAYRHSKLAQVLFTVEMRRRMGDKIIVNALHPGIVNTELLTGRNTSPLWKTLLAPLGWAVTTFGGMYTPEQGASTAVYLATHSRAAIGSGGYFADSAPKAPNPVALDIELGKEWWDESARAAGINP